ncbi:Pyridine nucleotide-disulphide oxidoreductase [Pustulibacterium marinum]|uniref:Pyridine nucleotide-disulphide oxidoreductase n=1 Tax=Pustulibacterium marinum TaxID=1224947 RepID=A0A1I7EST8_9FLAO|nr:FAD-dependent oxidoreductase [Pustulibacterium marinum]SFU26986.1 Pyridine nucleotide-disulphide oxidoreductase [Pustulibacterium marinum]
MVFDVLIIGGGAAGMQCALVLGSASNKSFAKDKNVGIVMHQKASHLQTALFNNVLGLNPGKLGSEILQEGKEQLQNLYPSVTQIDTEKVFEVSGNSGDFTVTTNKNSYKAKLVVVALGYTNLFDIEGLNEYVIPHKRSMPEKQRVQLSNKDHIVAEGIYVAGTLAGWSSQFAIAAGSGAQVATDILTLWNGGNFTKVHDKVEIV